MVDLKAFSLWAYLAESPLLWLTLTLSIYLAASWLHRRSHMHPLCNPVAVSVALIICVLLGTGTSYQTYFAGAQFVHFLLGPATVALAVPLYRQLARLRAIWLPVLISVVAGVATGMFSVVLVARLLGADRTTLLSLAPKSVTTPVAMGISQEIGGLPAVTAVMVVLTGILGAAIAPRLFSLVKISDKQVQGLAMGVAAHGIGTARAFQIDNEAGAFSGLAMALSALFAALLLPWLVHVAGF